MKKIWNRAIGIVFAGMVGLIVFYFIQPPKPKEVPIEDPELLEAFARPVLYAHETVTDRNYAYVTESFFVYGIYTGEWWAESPEGQGAYTVTSQNSDLFLEGDVLTGVFVNGILEGQGTLTKADGRQYTGAFVNGLPEGEGQMRWPNQNGSRYEGSWLAGQISGLGEMYYGNGDHYIGTWLNGKKNGTGLYFFANGDTYSGYFEDSRRTGQGLMMYADGGEYGGEFLADQRSGTGSMLYPDGSVYEGEFLNDMYDGPGKITWAGGNAYEGWFSKDQRTGPGKIFWANGDVWAGRFENGLLKADTTWSAESEKVTLADGLTWTDYPLIIYNTLPNCTGFTLRYYLHPVSGGKQDIGAKELNKNWRVYVYRTETGWKEVGSIQPAAQNEWVETEISFEPGLVEKVEVFPPAVTYVGEYRGSIELINWKHE